MTRLNRNTVIQPAALVASFGGHVRAIKPAEVVGNLRQQAPRQHAAELPE
jgi:hypothetical protein